MATIKTVEIQQGETLDDAAVRDARVNFKGKLQPSEKTDLQTESSFGKQVPLRVPAKAIVPAQAYFAQDKNNIDFISGHRSWTTSVVNPSDIIPIKFTEFQPKYGSLATELLRKSNILSQFVDQNDISFGNLDLQKLSKAFISNPIADSFIAARTDNTYTFPYLQLQTQEFTTQFGEGENFAGNAVRRVAGDFKQLVLNNPKAASLLGGKGKGSGIGLEFLTSQVGNIFGGIKDIGKVLYPAIAPAKAADKYYRASNPVGYSVTIELLNTTDFDLAKKHKELVELWSHNMGMGGLRNPIIGDSPCIYEVEIEGIRWCPAAKVDFSYEGVGNLIRIKGEPYPEAYICTFQIQEFFPPIRQVFHSYLKNDIKFRAIRETDEPFCEILKHSVGIVRGVLR